jgi:hypothetical protein
MTFKEPPDRRNLSLPSRSEQGPYSGPFCFSGRR